MLYQDSGQSVDVRVKDLLARMTIKEKVGQLNQRMLGWNAYKIVDGEVVLTDEFKNEVSFGDGLGAIYGIFRADGWNSNVTYGVKVEESVKVVNAIQKYIRENTRLGIPIFIAEECPHGHEALEATTFPTNIGIGSTWNTELYRKECEVIARELRSRGGHLALISTLDIATDPRWGRSEECYSEDPFLNGCFNESAVQGLQGENRTNIRKKDKVGAVLKHFCGQGATIGGHNGQSTNIGQRELREIHLQGMRKGAKAGAIGCMAAYNDIDGVPCHINRELLTDILREEMGFDGFVMSDGKGVDRLESVTGSLVTAGAAAVHAGVDMNLWNDAFLTLEQAVNDNLLDESELDLAVARILKVKFEMGLFDDIYIDETNAVNNIGTKEAKEVALNIAREVPVLLKNDNNILPLTMQSGQIAVIGPNADKIYNQLGDYTQWQEEGKVTTVLSGIKDNAPNGVKVVYEHGCSIRGGKTSEFNKACELAKKSDLVVLVLGGSSTREPGMQFEDNGAVFMDHFTEELDCGEAVDLADISLGGVQVELAKEMKRLGKPVVVILIQGRAHAIPWIANHADAVICGWYPGEKGGQAIGEILFGKICPNGRLAVSIPMSSAQLPVYYNRKLVNKYVDMSQKALYPFGYGLSYTTFELTDFNILDKTLTQEQLKAGKRFRINFTVSNTGKYDGKEVVQLYIYDKESCITRRMKELKDFKKIFIEKNQSVRVELSVGYEELGIYNYSMQYEVEKGNVQLMVGNSSEHIVFKTDIVII